ncbi:beta-galactosidase [Neocallimastix californiae]|uniref:beta-galactosidase n=1 Tax=Neocallimastix californiae TaxID=1754190 RepID=A0A1Y1ZNZ1_9FUNG|nr:beta-galactosidase [Neocallimastix californiae]|eukprot:ORY11959.1 beta-galactosidase [Neocallimastix californiae]
MKFIKAFSLTATFVGSLLQFQVNAVSFTGNEWTGKYGAEDIFAINREPASCNPVLIKILNQLKNENWDLVVVQNSNQAQSHINSGCFKSDFRPSADRGWKTVQLPKSWTCQGFDFSIYTNVGEPWQSRYDGYVPVPEAPVNYNPVGLYRKKFTLDSSMRKSGRRIYIEFDGVESAYYVYVNGQAVGYSEDTFSPHRFDITNVLSSGENTLAVEVHKFCDGTWFEDQDMIYDGGIFRDVFLVSAPDVQIRDYTVRTDLDSSFTNANLEISMDIRNLSGGEKSGWSVIAEAYDEAGNNILKGASVKLDRLNTGRDNTFVLKTSVNSPKLWSAEIPNLYALVLKLIDNSGNVQEILSTQLGFRKIGFTRAEVNWAYQLTTNNWQPITINGKRLLLKGVNRHDSDPFNGKAVPQQTLREDITLMKKNNINAIRTSHYSNDSYLYWLCNKYGMYVMGETNMESHALMDNNDAKAKFYEVGMDRTETAYKRLKIIHQSLHGGLFRDMIWYFKKNDNSRPVHSEGQGSGMGVDMSSNMYPGSDGLGFHAGRGKMPYVMCEYDHAMGNSVGALKEYWDVIRSADNMLAVTLKNGGWDYYSQSYAKTNLYSEEIKGKFYGYGGDWGDWPNDNSFCVNGLINPDRTPQPELAEVKFQYQSFWFSADASQLDNQQVSVYNENNFLNINDFDVTWTLLKNGIAIKTGNVKNANVAPLTRGTLKVPFEIPQDSLAGDEFYLDMSVKVKNGSDLLPEGTEISYGQIHLTSTGKPVKYDKGSDNITIDNNSSSYSISGKNFNFIIDKSTGTLKTYKYKGETLINEVDITYTIQSNGSVDVEFNVDGTRAGLGNYLRVGSIMILPKGAEKLSWYGNGPVETFNDRKTNGRKGVWESTVSDMFYPYMKADDCGNLTDIKWIAVQNNGKGASLLIAADGTVEASALHFTPEDLMRADHPFKLKPRKETILSVDYGSMGTGSATCGQATLDKYRLPSGKQYRWKFTIFPISSSNTGEEITTIYAKLRSDGNLIQDKSNNGLIIPISSGAKLQKDNNGNYISGALTIPHNSKIDSALEGRNSFTIEVNVVPTGVQQFNMLAGKGDRSIGFRTSTNSIDFFIYAGNEWRTVNYNMGVDSASGWVGRKHQVAGIYDAENNMLRVYADGRILGERSVGACPDTGRNSQGNFYEMRVYSKALTASELASQNTSSPKYPPNNQNVLLWLDFDNLSEGDTIEVGENINPSINPSEDNEEDTHLLKDGWYYIKNTGSNKYLTVKDGRGASSQNVEVNSRKQKWLLTNVGDDEVTLTTELGNYMLDVNSGSENNGANIQIYNSHGGDSQRFIIEETYQSDVYVIGTKVTNGYKVIDVEREGKDDGSNVCQWDNGEKPNQTWVFEFDSYPNGEKEKEPKQNPPQQEDKCWSTSLGYSCCKTCTDIILVDSNGKWGVEGDDWCGIPTSCEKQSCGIQGYSCCKSSCNVYEEDSDGKWSIENDEWCLIDDSKC